MFHLKVEKLGVVGWEGGCRLPDPLADAFEGPAPVARSEVIDVEDGGIIVAGLELLVAAGSGFGAVLAVASPFFLSSALRVLNLRL